MKKERNAKEMLREGKIKCIPKQESQEITEPNSEKRKKKKVTKTIILPLLEIPQKESKKPDKLILIAMKKLIPEEEGDSEVDSEAQMMVDSEAQEFQEEVKEVALKEKEAKEAALKEKEAVSVAKELKEAVSVVIEAVREEEDFSKIHLKELIELCKT